MKKSRFKAGAVELGKLTESDDIQLMGTAALIEQGSVICQFTRTHEEDTRDRLFKDIVGMGYKCYYLIEQVDCDLRPGHDHSTVYEKGVGSLRREGSKIMLHRDSPILWGENPTEERYYWEGQRLAEFHEDGCYIRVSSLSPPTYIQALSSPHSVIASIDAFQPTPVEIEDNCLLGRIDDVIQSVDMEELSAMDGFSTAVAVALMETQKQLRLKARHIQLDRKNAKISASSLQAMPVYNDENKPPPQQGMIIYNADSNCLEYFDGTKWRTLVWKEEDENTS